MPKQQRPQVRAVRPQRSASIGLRLICPAARKGSPDFLCVPVVVPVPHCCCCCCCCCCAQRSLPCPDRCVFRLPIPPLLAVSVYHLFSYLFFFSCFSFSSGAGMLSAFAKNGILAVRARPVVRTGIGTCPNIEPARGLYRNFTNPV